MFSFLINLKRRIRKLLKVKTESRQLAGTTVRSRTIKLLLLLTTSVLVSLLYPGEEVYDPLDMPRRGEIALEDIIAPLQITVLKSDAETADEKELIRLSLPTPLDCDTTVALKALSDLHGFFDLADSLTSDSGWRQSGLESEFTQILAGRYPTLSQDVIGKTLLNSKRDQIRVHLLRILGQEIYKIGLLPDQSIIPASRGKHVLVRRGAREGIYNRDKILRLAEANAQLLSSLNRMAVAGAVDVELFYPIGRTFIHPNLSLNQDDYARRLEEELASVSAVKEVVNPGAIIVRAGQKVSRRQEVILRQMARMMRSEAAQSGWLQTMLPLLARILLVLAAFSALYLFLYYFRRDIYHSNPKLLAIILVFAFELLLIHFVNRADLSVYLYPVAMLSIVITILFDAEVGLLATLVLALLLGIMHRFDFNLALMTMTAGVVACFTSRRVRQRTHFFRIILFVSFTYGAYVFVIENLRLTPDPELLTLMGFGLLNGVVSAFITIGILPFFESIFGITTDITLLELSDLNHPLLKRMAMEAPGSYHHSILVGNLSEAAAKVIGCNSLLARVGAYYHDIGKIEIPEYFVENQLTVKSRHESLTPSMSAIVLGSHVKKGRALGEEANIPDDVLNFIEEHHGTMVMSYFYNKAAEQGGDSVSIDKFRYPGPKPQVRETGIAMLADAVEAASRTLDDPKPARIGNLIQRIINDRFQSGELDECPLTLRDLAKIKDAFAQVLIGAFHQRVAYPKRKDEKS